jgi:hypothetical protein
MSSSPIDYENNIIKIFQNMIDQFKANLLTLNFIKTYFIQFWTKNCAEMDMHTDYGNNHILC